MQIYKRIRDKRRNRSGAPSTSDLGTAIDYRCSHVYEKKEQSRPDTPLPNEDSSPGLATVFCLSLSINLRELFL